MANSKRSIPQINAGSMADIAFLLLIFFLVTTTIDSDKGLAILLPPPIPPDAEPPPKPRPRNVLNVLVNSNDQLLVRGKILPLVELSDEVKKHITNFGRDENYSESPSKAIVSIKNDRGTSYSMYVKVQNEFKRGYNEVRDEEAQLMFGRPYDKLPENAQDVIRKKFPQKISEAEPENVFDN